MLERFRYNMVYTLISIFAAIFIWFFVFSDSNPIIEDVVIISLEATDLDRNLVVAEKPNSINIRFQGNTNVINRVSSRDFRAFVPLDLVEVGLNSIQVVASGPDGVRIISVEPSFVDVYIDELRSIQLPVEIIVDGDAASGFVMGNPRFTPSQVLIYGPGNFLESVGRVYVNAAFSNVSADYFQNLPVLVEDRNGTLIMDWVEVRPGNVEVLIPVTAFMPSKIVPVIIDFIGELTPGLEIGGVLAHPSTIRIYGPRNILDEIRYLPLEVDINGIQADVNFELDLAFPQGITNASDNRFLIMLEVNDENQNI